MNKEMKEEWVQPKFLAKMYEVSTFGRVRSNNYRRRGITKTLKLHLRKDGYYDIKLLMSDGRFNNSKINNLVMRCFVGIEGMQINHIDSDKSNNKLSNLECITPRERRLRLKEFKY